MIAYICTQIIDGTLDYTYVVTKRTDLKEAIDTYLINQGKSNSIVS